MHRFISALVILAQSTLPSTLLRDTDLQLTILPGGGESGLHNNSNLLQVDYILDDEPALHPQLAQRYQRLKQHQERVKRSVRTNHEPLVIELAIFSDEAFEDFTRSRYPNKDELSLQKLRQEIILTIVNSVQLYFDNPTLKLKLKIQVVDIIPLKSNQLQPSGNIREYLDRFCVHQRGRRVNSASWDHALLLTGIDLHTTSPSGRKELGSSGMAYLSGMCSSQASCTIAEARSLGSTALIIAHELAHNLGAEHDGVQENRDCDISAYIMGPRLGAGATDWSECTVRNIDAFLSEIHRYQEGRCLESQTHSVNTLLNKVNNDLPGRRFGGNDQCNFLYGQDWSFYTGFISNGHANKPCEGIWCRNQNYLKSPNAAALQGTTCGDNRVCFRGGCEAESTVQRVLSSESSDVTGTTSTTTSTTTTTTRRTTRRTSSRDDADMQNTLCTFFRAFGVTLSGC